MSHRLPNTNQRQREMDILARLNLLPPGSEFAEFRAAETVELGLLRLWSLWRRDAPKSRQSRAARIHSLLHGALESGARLTFSIPGRDTTVCQQWLGERVYWWPAGIPSGTGLGIASSRLRRAPDSHESVLQALRHIAAAFDRGSEHLIASAGTSLAEYIEGLSRVYELPVLKISCCSNREAGIAWLEDAISNRPAANSHHLMLSPAADNSNKPDTTTIPIRDRVIALVSERLVILSLRDGGNWSRLLDAGLTANLWRAGSVRIHAGDDSCPSEVVERLQLKGAVAWHLSSVKPTSSPVSSTLQQRAIAGPTEKAVLVELTAEDQSDGWLLHWTRSNLPQSNQGDLAESLAKALTHEPERSLSDDCSAAGVLRRILKDGLIRASNRNSRTGRKVVCLTAVTLTELAERRVYRRHRMRWDFEPYGVAVRSSRIRQLGGRPVIYGTETDWESIPEGERLWFQPQTSSVGTEQIDWSVENEWRVPGDVPLATIPRHDVFVFCKTEAEAQLLRIETDLPVISVEAVQATNSRTGS